MLARIPIRRVQQSAVRRHVNAEPRDAYPAAHSRPAGRCACGGVCPRCLGAALRTPSRPIDAADLSFLEHRLGHDLGAVRLHHDAAAEAASSALGARAWTLGQHVVLGRGEYRPGQDGYRRLLAHEAAHVLQQGSPEQPASLSVAAPDGASEREAERVAAAAMSPEVAHVRRLAVSAGPAVIQRALNTDAPVTVQENLAERFVTGGRTAGFVLYKLNGKVLNLADDPNQRKDPDQPDKIKANARGAIKRPVVAQKNYEVDGPTGKEMHYDAHIAEVPVNTLATEIHVPTPPEWKTMSTEDDVRKTVPDQRLQHCKGSDPCEFSVIGRPDSATLAANTIVHENLHNADIATAFETVFRPWDTQMQLAKDTGEVFSGTAAQAKNALWSFLGSTPEAIADAFVDTVDAMGKKLHAGLAEPIVGFHDPVAALDCSTVTVYVEGGK